MNEWETAILRGLLWGCALGGAGVIVAAVVAVLS